MADVIQKAISANDIVNGAAVIMTVSPAQGGGVGDKHQDVNPKIQKDTATTGFVSKYSDRFI